MSGVRGRVQDALYGEFTLDEPLWDLSQAPVVQRLRHVRLSNIDSMDMPGIAGVSRYEHVLGVAYLASQVGPYQQLSYMARTAFGAAGLLHDWAITAFGHLVEEAFQYAGAEFDHEQRLLEIVFTETPDEVGGVQRQVLMGRETGLLLWADKVTTSARESRHLLGEVSREIVGAGEMGQLIASDIDLDNIDNVFRLAHHMGLGMNRTAPVELARAIVAVDRPSGAPIFESSARRHICHWQEVRRAVYERLMLARSDFVGKLMILYATLGAVESEEIGRPDWNLTDWQLVERLLRSRRKDVREAMERWISGELWELAGLSWMEGSRPSYRQVREFSQVLSGNLGRPCFAYAIKDKRVRQLTARFIDGTSEQFGVAARMWLLGIGSASRRRFTTAEARTAFRVAESYFGTRILAVAEGSQGAGFADGEPGQHWLF